MTCIVTLAILAVALALGACVYATGGDLGYTLRTGWRWIARKLRR